ncbi:MAG: redoxin domain-containing protein, partial [bacterium]|nr:redoxin domain-containing protein [bacterium]
SPAIKNIAFPMIADQTGRLSRAFGVYIDEGTDEGRALRGTFIVNPQGQLRTIEIHHNDIGRSARETLRKLQAAKFVSAHKGLVCPAGWEPGKEALKPGLDLVGKI